jgi:ABC-type transport system involved in Fe-S cluster assembly fused permease/ATPase subunit
VLSQLIGSVSALLATSWGKTTLVKLLLRFYDPPKGRILVNSTDRREIDPGSSYTRIGVLFQDFAQYRGASASRSAMVTWNTLRIWASSSGWRS